MKKHAYRAQLLRAAGYKLTNARLTVLEALEQQPDHLNSNEIVQAVAALNPAIGRASVFRALDLFTRLGFIRPTLVDTGMSPVYALLPDGHHHHIICNQCRRVIDFDDCGLSALSRQLETQFGVQLTGHLLEFYGICRECRDFEQGNAGGAS